VDDGVMLGRSPGADVRIEDQFASSNHARVYIRDGGMIVEDLGSTNGTYLNNRPLQGSARIGPGDTIRIGDTEFRYQD
jgi:pSer/pThr/pTyr-binding forkhead associated (FHA) protein